MTNNLKITTVMFALITTGVFASPDRPAVERTLFFDVISESSIKIVMRPRETREDVRLGGYLLKKKPHGTYKGNESMILSVNDSFQLYEKHSDVECIIKSIKMMVIELECASTFDARSFGMEIVKKNFSQKIDIHEQIKLM